MKSFKLKFCSFFSARLDSVGKFGNIFLCEVFFENFLGIKNRDCGGLALVHGRWRFEPWPFGLFFSLPIFLWADFSSNLFGLVSGFLQLLLRRLSGNCMLGLMFSLSLYSEDVKASRLMV